MILQPLKILTRRHPQCNQIVRQRLQYAQEQFLQTRHISSSSTESNPHDTDDLFPEDGAGDYHLEDVAHLYHKDVVPKSSGAFAPETELDDDPYADDHVRNRKLRRPEEKFDPYNPKTFEKLSGAYSKKWERKRKLNEFDPSKPIRIRVLDVDRLELEEVHRHFMFTLTRNLPAEHCLKVASRVGQFRDKQTHQSYENLIRDCGRVFGPTQGPELVALFCRCYATISVPYMVDYIRKFGHFSKSYLAKLIDKSEQPRFFDFMRYEHCGGVKPLPGIIREPYALASYTRLLSKCSAKRYMFEALQEHGQIPKSMLEDGNLDWDKMEFDDRVKESIAGHPDPNRPQIMDKIIALEHAKASGIQIYDEDDDSDLMLLEPEEEEEMLSTEQQFSMQFQRVAQEKELEEEIPQLNPDEKALDYAEKPEETWYKNRRNRFKYNGKIYALTENGWQTQSIVPKRRRKRQSHAILRTQQEEKLSKKAESMKILEERYEARRL